MLVMNEVQKVSQMTQKDWDEQYTQLISSHDGLDDEASARLNACLVLLLVKQVSNVNRVSECLKEARSFALNE